MPLLTSSMACLAATFSTWDFVIGGVLLAVLLIGGAVIVPWVRRKYHPTNMSSYDGGSAFDMDRVEMMRQQGLITDDEFRTLRRAALGLDTSAAKPENSTSSAPTGSDDEESSTAVDGQEADADEDGPEKE